MKNVVLMLICLGFAGSVFSLDQIDEPTLPKGKPFVIINDAIIEVQDELQELQDVVDGMIIDVTTLEGQVAALQDGLALLELDVEANADAIVLTNERLAQAEADLLLKQNIVNGVCPVDQAMVSVNPTENDGQIVCAPVGGTLDLVYVSGYKWGAANKWIGKVVYCPTGYQVTGGGGSWYAGIKSTEVHTDHSWIVYGNVGTSTGIAMIMVDAVCIK